MRAQLGQYYQYKRKEKIIIMIRYSKFNIVYRLQKWMDSVPGQTFLNYSYSWGASIVILGALFKLTHLPGGNLILFIGMGTEVFVFFLSAFDRPFDKTADGRDIPSRLTEEYLETGKVTYSGVHQSEAIHQPGSTLPVDETVRVSGTQEMPNRVASVDKAAVETIEIAGTAGSSQMIAPQNEGSSDLVEAQSNYVDALKTLTETLGKVSEQSVRLTRDSEEMENLNRTLTGICKVYEMQLKGASQQIGTIDQINDQTRKMAQQIEQLNTIYARMIHAMTVNMQANNSGMNPMQE